MELRRKFKSEPLTLRVAKVLQQSDLGLTADQIAGMTGSTKNNVMTIIENFKKEEMVTIEGSDKDPVIKVSEKGKQPAA